MQSRVISAYIETHFKYLDDNNPIGVSVIKNTVAVVVGRLILAEATMRFIHYTQTVTLRFHEIRMSV